VDLHPEEPPGAPWRPVDDDALLELLGRWLPGDRPALVLVDGRSGSGKSTFAGRAARLLGGSLVSTDDIAWHHAVIAWADLLVEGVIEPWRRGEEVRFRPPAWEARGREGAVAARAGAPLVVEGVAAGRAALAAWADLVVWVQSDRTLARERGLARDVVVADRTPEEAAAIWDGWMTEEDPFLAADRPWERAPLWVLGTPPDARTWVSERRTD
jgi:hypothetical protein